MQDKSSSLSASFGWIKCMPLGRLKHKTQPKPADAVLVPSYIEPSVGYHEIVKSVLATSTFTGKSTTPAVILKLLMTVILQWSTELSHKKQ